MMMHANDPVPDVRDLRPDTPDWLADLVHGLLAKDPEDRPAGAASVAAALAAQEALAGAATTVLPGGRCRDDAAARRVPPPVPAARCPCRCPGPTTTGAGAATPSPGCWVSWPWRPWRCSRGTSSTTARTRPATPTPTPVGLDARADQRGAARRRSRPTPTPTPTPTTESPTPSADPADAVASSLSAFSDEVAAVERDGLVDKDAAKRLDDVVRDIERALRDDDPEKVAEEADKLVEEYDKAVQEGAIPARGGDPPRPAPRRTSPTPSTRTRADVRNWAGNVIFSAQAVEEPQSVERAAVARRLAPARAGPRHGPLVLAGRRHDGHPRLHEVPAPRGRGAPRAAGRDRARWRDVCRGDGRAARRGWALHNLGSLPHISVAGCLLHGHPRVR